MIIRGKSFNLSQFICLALYYGIARWLPQTGRFFNIGGSCRLLLCKCIFKKCGQKVNIERKACFGSGLNIEVGDYSGIGLNAYIPGDTIIGKYVMMGPNCIIFQSNHKTDDTSTPMMFQGMTLRKQTIIDDDVWIGQNVIMTPGRHISRGSIIAAGSVLTKDFPEFSVVGGNPSQLIKKRL